MTVIVRRDRILVTSVSYVEPEVSASYIDLEATASYIDLQATASYIDIQVFAEVTMPDVLSVEVINPMDNAAIFFGKQLSTTYSGFLDSETIHFGKGNFDTVTMVDDTDIDVWIDKYFKDIQVIAEAKAVAYQKGVISDSITELDLQAFHLTKAFADTINTPLDKTVRLVHKALADSISFTDHATANKLFEREFSDSILAPDFSFWDLYEPKTDAATVSEDSTFSVDKVVSENLTLIDGMDGDLDFAFVKVVSELVAPSDAKTVDFMLAKADNVLSSSSGILSMQDYCDITYFLEDYVGVSRTFT